MIRKIEEKVNEKLRNAKKYVTFPGETKTVYMFDDLRITDEGGANVFASQEGSPLGYFPRRVLEDVIELKKDRIKTEIFNKFLKS